MSKLAHLEVPQITKIDGALYKHAQVAHAKKIVIQPTLLTHGGVPVAVYNVLEPADVRMLRVACQQMKYRTGTRAMGMKNRSQTFGYLPRVAYSTDYCRLATSAYDFPNAHRTLKTFGDRASELFASLMPNQATAQAKWLGENILPDWRMNFHWTGGIVNDTSNLTYHRDQGNVPGGYSLMVVLRSGTGGGELIVPELEVGFECADASYLLFIGQSWLHGVAPIFKSRPSGYRYSVVYYAMNGLKFGLPLAEENKRIKEKRTERERARVVSLKDA